MKNKKVGIITYHFARNYGAVLQCYALQKFIGNQGYQVEILNYKTHKQEQNNSLFNKRKGIKNIVMNIALYPFKSKRIIKDKKFEEFIQKEMNCTNRIYSLEELKNKINDEGFKYIISGSDQVWNPRIGDFEDAFFFPFKCAAKKISYAASIGGATLEELDNYKKWINDFENISVREETTSKILNSILEKKVKVVLDPTMLLNNDEWKIVEDDVEEEYMLCYFINKSNFKEGFKIAKKIAKQRRLKIKIINARFSLNSFRKGTIVDAGPIDFIRLMKKASFICTDSFHGTIFSIIFNKPFLSIDRKDNKNDTRKSDLLKKLSLEDRLIRIPNDEKINIKDTKQEDIDGRLNKIREDSINFLKKSLK